MLVNLHLQACYSGVPNRRGGGGLNKRVGVGIFENSLPRGVCLIRGGGGTFLMFTDLIPRTLCSVDVVCINLKGLQIKVGMNFCVDPKPANS